MADKRRTKQINGGPLISCIDVYACFAKFLFADLVLVIGCFHFHSYLLQKICVQRYLDNSVWVAAEEEK